MGPRGALATRPQAGSGEIGLIGRNYPDTSCRQGINSRTWGRMKKKLLFDVVNASVPEPITVSAEMGMCYSFVVGVGWECGVVCRK